ncbi:MAG TPA: TetR/AcrR family transcriptional regulator [Acidimicrobiales bacterium]|nr:TetR/AcrR family transcriptional regulator [Acidimicrobiales bacterium]
MVQRKDEGIIGDIASSSASPALPGPEAATSRGAMRASGPGRVRAHATTAEVSAGTRQENQPRWLARDEDDVPGRAALTRRRIVRAALQLVETHGLDALTMRRVAAALQVTPMSLYNHVSDKAELVDLMVDFIIGPVVEAAANDTGDWERRLRKLVARNYQMWREHPGFVKVYTEGVTMGPNGLANVEMALGLLREAGFCPNDAAAAFMMLYRWNVSSLLVAPARPVSRAPARSGSGSSTQEERIDRYFSALPLDDIPNVRATAAHLSGHNIDFGLDVIMAGFKARIAAQVDAAAIAASDREP